MILIADSGATKTDWIVSDSQQVIKTGGLNPFFVSSSDIIQTISESELYKLIGKVREIYFYGSGCSSEEGKTKIYNSLRDTFGISNIQVETDLLGACRSLFGMSNGIAVILGTGSNSALFENGKIKMNFPSLGYILGDEGSGSYLGKKFLSDFLSGNMHDNIKTAFEERYKFTLNDILTKTYSEVFPNRFLASFTLFLKENINNENIYRVVYEGINDFFIINLLRYPGVNSLNIRFTGSVSYYFSDVIFDLGRKYNVNIDKIEQNPIGGLIDYHLK